MAKTSAFSTKPDVQTGRQDTENIIYTEISFFVLLVKTFELKIKYAGLIYFK